MDSNTHDYIEDNVRKVSSLVNLNRTTGRSQLSTIKVYEIKTKRGIKLLDFVRFMQKERLLDDSYKLLSDNCQQFVRKCFDFLSSVKDDDDSSMWKSMTSSEVNI